MESRSRIARSLMGIVCLQIALGPQAVVLAQSADVVVAPVPADDSASMASSANGTPVLNISAANSAGVSHNRFTSYDVDARGLVINNSAANAVSLIGGGTPGNANLANGAASLILNEVISANAGSQLNGYQEVLGQSAELVIANPWGITCNGCGFVNTPRVTLATGVPTLSASGALQGFTITGGLLAVTGEGMDATRQTALDLLARSVTVDGNILAGGNGGASGDLRIFAGAGQFDYATRVGSALAAGGGAAPQFAIDSSALGGMYADRIRLLVTEQGAGVRAAGDLAALAEDLTLDASGRIELRGATSAGRDLTVRGSEISVTLPDDDTYVYGGRDLNLFSAGALSLGTGSIGATRDVTFTGSSLTDLGGANSLRFATDGGSLRANVSGVFDLSGGLWHAPRISFNAVNAQFNSGSVLFGYGTAGSSLDVTAAGSITVNGGELYSGGGASLVSNRVEVGADGVVSADGALEIRGEGSASASGSALVNRGSIGGGDINIASSSITNSGVIWSSGDLTLSPVSLQQHREAGATSNPLIGAGRDLTIAYAGDADLRTGDLQAGRDLTITGRSINDLGAVGSSNTIADVRYAGRNLVATAQPGGNVYIGGGSWFSQGDLRLTGDSLYLGSWLDRQIGARIAGVDVALAGAWGGSGTVALTARSAGITFDMDASVFSGNDLTLWQPSAFTFNAPNVLQSSGLLSLSAGGAITNSGTIVGGSVLLDSNNGIALDFTNTSTGVLAGDSAVRIGSPAFRANNVRILTAATGSSAGVYGGALDIDAINLENYGLLQGVGPYSNIDVDTLTNDINGRILGFANTNGQGGLGIGAQYIANRGLIYDSSVLRINANAITNYASGALAGPGLLQIYTQGVGGPSGMFDNLGEIWGGSIDLILYNGFTNGRDVAVIANRALPASIYATNSLTIAGVGPSSLINYGRIESEGDIHFVNVGSGNALLQNVMSKVTDAELRWSPGTGNMTASGHLGLLTENPGSNHTGWTDITLGGTEYYRFTETHGGSYAYLDRRDTDVQSELLNVPVESLHRPTIRAGRNLSIDGFDSVLNYSGSLGAVGDLSITSSMPGSSVTNASWQLGSRFEIEETVERVRCMTFADDPINCVIAHDHRDHSVYSTGIRYAPGTATSDGLPGLIYAGGTLSINVAGTVTNAGPQGPFAANPKNRPGQESGVSVSGPGSAGSRDGASLLNLNGSAISLPSSANGRFVGAQGSGNDPLFETNPLFGIDSVNLGSEYLAKLLGLKPEEQARRIGDDNYEGYLIQEQVQAATGRGVLAAYWSSGDMVKALFDNAADEAARLDLGYGKALTPEQIASLKSDIVWMVEQEVKGQKVLIPVVYLSDATRATVADGSSMEGYNVDIKAGTLTNAGGNITAANSLRVKTTGNIENLSGRMAGWNVRLDAGGDIVNSTLVKRSGTAENGIDIAQRTAVIEAGNTAVLKAGRDINVSGAWVAAGKDAALIAGRNVNVESVALTANAGGEDGGDSWSRQTQTALGAGVLAGGNLAIQAGQDVSLRGAEVAAGGTAAIRAERDVNIGVLELTNKSTSTTTSTGRYDALDMSRDAGTIGLGFGVEKKKTTETTTTTVGVGSSVAGGKGVQISTGKGDVNITGSAVDAGEDGIVIDSARNVNINAYNDKTETESTTESLRVGVALDLSTDGAFAGTSQSGNKTTDTTTQTTARTSSLTSGGKVVIRGKGDVTNEGTQIDAAGDVVMAGENVINKAARDTYTTSTTTEKWETKQQQGITTNGMGSSIANAAQGKGNQVTVANVESQVRLTGSGSKETNTSSSTQARATNVKAGGNVIVVAKNSASDEGTQYQAGQDIIISAEEYENKAAADTTGTSSERTYGSGKLTVGLNTSVEVAMTASAEGGHEKSSETTSTAKTGGMKAGGNVIIEARSGDVTLEGTQVEGKKGVGISAAGDINLNQANDTVTKKSSSESGSGRVSGSVSLLGTGGSVGAGASARLAESEEKTSTAVTGNLRSGEGNVQLNAGRDLKSQGTGIEAAGNVALKAGRDIDLAAATDTVTRTGSVDAGGADVNVGFGTGAAKGNGGASVTVDFERSRTDYQETTEKGSAIKAGGTFSVDAGRDARLEGTQVDAESASLKTGGNLLIESAQHTIKDDSYSVSGRVEASASKGGGAGGASTVGQGSSGTTGNKGGGNAGGGNAQVDVKRSYQDIEKNTNATINTRGGTTLDVGGDMTMAGANINAQGGVAGQVAGNLNIETRVDKEIVDQTDVKAYAGAAPIGGVGGANKVDRGQNAVQAGANHVGQTGLFADVDTKQKDNLAVGTSSGISGGNGGIDVRVGGNTTLKGATNAGTDFKTQGQTSVETVETRTKESSFDIRATGTVASAAGSDKGKGGDYGLNVATPSSFKNAPKAGQRPNVPNDSAPNAAPSARPRTGTDAPNTPDVTRPRAGSTGGDVPAPTRPRTGTVVADNAPPPRSSSVPYANIPDATRPRTGTVVADNAPQPPRQSGEPYANVPDVTRPRTGTVVADNAPQPPRQSGEPYANVPDVTRPRTGTVVADNAPQPPRQSSEPYANLPDVTRPRTGTVVADNAPPPRQSAEPYANADTPDASRPRANSLLADDNSAPPADAPSPPPQRVALVDYPRKGSLPDGVVEQLMPKTDSLKDGVRFMEDDITASTRNLKEIDAYAKARDAVEAKKLLDQYEKSLQPPRVREDGLKEFGLMPVFVGENIDGFDNWNSRAGDLIPGKKYRPDAVRQPDEPVKYLTESERDDARLFVASDGTLVDSKGKRLDSGQWIFVIDQKGRMIARPWDQALLGKLHHSSLTAGEPVLMAGELHVALGGVHMIANRSGHFRPDTASFEHFMAEFLGQGMKFTPDAEAKTVRMIGKPGGGVGLEMIGSNSITDGASAPRGGPGMLADMKSPFPPPPPRVPVDNIEVPVVHPGQVDEDPYNTEEGPERPPAQSAPGNPPTGLVLPWPSDNQRRASSGSTRSLWERVPDLSTNVSLRLAA